MLLLGGFTLVGGLAGFLPRWISRENPVWAVLAGVCASLLMGMANSALTGDLTRVAAGAACTRAGLNALLMLPIYGIVLMISGRRSSSADFG